MRTKSLFLFIIQFIAFANYLQVNGQIVNVPSNFPQYKVTVNNSPDDGYLFLATDQIPDKKPGYLMMLDNYGTPVYYRYFNKELSGFCVQPNGLLSFMGRGAVGTKFYLIDSTFTIVDSLAAKSPYATTDSHDFRALKNGHFVFLANDSRIIDMSSFGGKTNATVTGCVIQEQDENKNVVFNWNTWDHFQIADSYADLTVSQIDLINHSSIDVDEDGNYFLSSRSLNEITKINRQTGDVIWRLGGKNNQFSFTDPTSRFSMPNDFRKLSNGHFTVFDNGSERNPAYSRALEYSIDQTNKVVGLLWNFDADKKIYSDNSGSTTRLQTGNTVIGYGYNKSNPAILEVHPDSSVAFRLELPDNTTSYRAFKSPWKNKLFEPITNTIDFGEWDGYTTAEYLLIMKNNSNSVVTLTSYSTHTKAFGIDNTFPVNIPANGQVILKVTYFPSMLQTGLIKDILTINSDINTSSLVQRIAQQVKLIGSLYDGTSPLATISLVGKENVPQDTVVYINLTEPIRMANNTEFNYSNIDPFVVLKKNNANGEKVPFDAVISTEKNKITIKPKSLLSHTQTYYVAILGGFEDYSNNSGALTEASFKTVDLTPPIGTFTPPNGATNITSPTITVQYNEPVRNIDNSEITSVNLNSLVTLKTQDVNGSNVGFTATINVGKTAITVTPSIQLSSNSTYYVAIGEVVEDNNNNKANAISSTFTTGSITSVTTDLPVGQVFVYPNPSSGIFKLQFNEANTFRFKVTDMNGRIVYNKIIKGINTHSIDLSSFSDGIYILGVEIDDYSTPQIFKLVKQHE